MLDALEAAVDEVVGLAPEALADTEAVESLHRCLAKLEAATTRALAAFDASGAWAASGARSAAAWVSTFCGPSVPAARHRIALGRALRRMPATEAAWCAGQIDHDQVAVLAKARTPATEELFDRCEEQLVGYAKSMRHHRFVRAVAYWSLHADPEGSENKAKKAEQGRRLSLSQTFGGTWVGDFVLDPLSGELVSQALRRIEAELFDAERAEARSRLGHEPALGDLARTAPQRRADALVEMARRAMAMPAGARKPEPLISVLVGYETLAGPICELASNTVVSPGSLLRWLDSAWVERVVFDSPSRVIDVGVARRLFEGATRRAVVVRDRECFHPTCDEPAVHCEVDHVEPYSAGGLTTTANGRPACRTHNRLRHQRPPPDG